MKFSGRLLVASGLVAIVLGAGLASLQAGETPKAQAYDPAADALFTQPYIDKDEWRDTPVRHRYLHGGFKGTETRFSFYFPPKAAYHGRFFQHFTPAPDSENLGQQGLPGEENKVAFAVASGGYFVETNGGGAKVAGFGSADPTIGAFRANAAAATFSRTVALKMYGGKRPFGYIYGGSGGAYRTTGAFENTRGVWDGAVPYVLGSSMAIPNSFTVRMHAMRLLDGKFDQIVDALEPGGSGDPYAGLTPEQAGALREVTRMGFPPLSWFGWRTMGIHGFAALYGGVVMADPGYFTDFWTKPGYLGFDHPESFAGYRMQHATAVAAPITAAEAAQAGLNTRLVAGKVQGNVDDSYAALQGDAAKQIVAFRLATPPPANVQFLGGDLVVQSGAAKGARLMVMRIAGDTVVLGIVDARIAAKIAPGDAVQLDNSNFLAAQTYHRHQVPGPEFAVWDQFRGADGKPLYPQRRMLLGPLFTQATAGSVPSGNFEGKMILVESLWDREAYPWSADWYRARVAQHFGKAVDAHFRLWYTDHALHGDSTRQEDPTRTVSYIGELQQALHDVVEWVEHGTPPPASTGYRVNDGQVQVAPTAPERHGVQPVVSLRVNGAASAAVRVGQPVALVGAVVAPPGTYTQSQAQSGNRRAVRVEASHAFASPGTYFVTLRGTAQTRAYAGTPFGRLQNLARVRVVVQ
ncbi:MAG: hypothetical protein KGM17_00520 [Sphingomonadales bacterium]|nr:hypothetical protein [Sphingomonadales bacterium]